MSVAFNTKYDDALVGDPKHHRSLFPKDCLWPRIDELPPVDSQGRFIGKIFKIVTCANEGWYVSSYSIGYNDLRCLQNAQARADFLNVQREIALDTLAKNIRREEWLTPFRWVWNRLPDWLYGLLCSARNRWYAYRYRSFTPYDDEDDD